MGLLVYDLLHMLRQFYLVGEEVNRSMGWLIKRLIKVGAKVAYPRSEVVCSCGVGVSLGRTLPLCVRVTRTDVKNG